jgi:hypothetical protein
MGKTREPLLYSTELPCIVTIPSPWQNNVAHPNKATMGQQDKPSSACFHENFRF